MATSASNEKRLWIGNLDSRVNEPAQGLCLCHLQSTPGGREGQEDAQHAAGQQKDHCYMGT